MRHHLEEVSALIDEGQDKSHFGYLEEGRNVRKRKKKRETQEKTPVFFFEGGKSCSYIDR